MNLRCLFLFTVAGLLLAANQFCGKAASLQLLSARDPSVPFSSSANGNSVAPAISSDGRFILFSSDASDVVPGDNGPLAMNLFLRDVTSNTTTLVSANLDGSGGGNGDSLFGKISSNGRYAVFESDATDLVSGDTNGVADIFVRDLLNGTTRLVSVAADGGAANGASSDAFMTPDAAYVVFVSTATNLIANDTNKIPDVFVRDLNTDTTRLVSVGAIASLAFPKPTMASPVITPNGGYVAFFSTASGLAPSVPSSSRGEIYVRDMASNLTIWASSNAAEIVSATLHLTNMPSYHPAISDNGGGRFVAFKSGWTNGAVQPAGSGVPAVMVFRYDITSGSTVVVSSNGFAPWAYNDDVYGPEMSPDGRWIAFVATNEAPISSTSVELWDAETGTNLLISAAMDGSFPSNTFSSTPVLSDDGMTVSFLSNATNLTADVVSNGFHLYTRNVETGITRLADADTNGVGSVDNQGAVPVLSSDGRWLAFSSLSGGLIAGDKNNDYDVFLRDGDGGTTELISRRDPASNSRSGNGLSFTSPFSISADGRWLVFSSYANDLTPNDTNGTSDVFARDLLTGSNYLVSVGINGLPALGGDSENPVISADGRYVAFVSAATNLVLSPLYTSASAVRNNIFLHDLQTGTNVMVSGTKFTGMYDCLTPALSRNGRYACFLTFGSGIVWCDIAAGKMITIPGGAGSTIPPSMSVDGRYVAYQYLGGSQARVWDSVSSAIIYMGASSVVSMALSPTGNKLLYQTPAGIYLADVVNNSNVLFFPTKKAIQSAAQWSADGHFFAFITESNLVSSGPTDGNGTNDVYLCDASSGDAILVSLNAAGTASANGPSDSPVVSGDGRFVVYRSFATDIVSGITNTPNIFIFDRVTGSNSLLAAAGTATAGRSWNSNPAISANGKTVVFQSWDSLAPIDLNFAQDAFASALSPWGDSDTDADGIPDLWMSHYFGHPTGQDFDESKANDDADGDGMTTMQEYLAGSDPVDYFSALRVVVAISTTNNATLTWPAAPGKNYEVQYKDDLNDPAWLHANGDVLIIGGQGRFTIPAIEPNRFYRILSED